MRKLHINLTLKGLATLLVTTLLLSSCGDFLEIEPRNEIVLEQFWNEKADVDVIVSGCYSALQSRGCISRMIIWGESRSDNIAAGTNATNDASLLNVLNENITAKNGYTTWVDFYNVINRCNTVLKYAPQVAEIDPGYTVSELNATIAEMVALRSLSYFYLIRAFRDVPFSREAFIDDDQPMDLPATPFNAVLDSLIDDLESVKDMAIKRYPVTYPIYQTGRITQDAIHAMLCEMYLWKQDYSRCIEYADKVINSKKKLAEEYKNSSNSRYETANDEDNRTNGFPLVSNLRGGNEYGQAYNYLFGNVNESESEINQQEIIFQLVFNNSPQSNSMMENGAINEFYGNSNVNIGYMAPSDYILDDIAKTSGRTVFDDKNKKVDSRLYYNCKTDRKSIYKYVFENTSIDVTTATTPELEDDRNLTKWPEGQNGSNWIIYRLSDIMLMKAEALAEQLQEGSDQGTIDFNRPILSQAFNLVNAVNKRSICQNTLKDTLVESDYVTKAMMQELVLRERQRELMSEGKRWFDLVRRARRDGNTSVLISAALHKVSTGSALISNKLTKMDAIYWPYNSDEIKINTKLVQNPAFKSGENDSYE